MANFHKHRKTLLMLSKAKPKAAKKIIAQANSSLIKGLAELSLNILNGVVPLTRSKERHIRKFKNNLRTMVGQASLSEKKKAIQRGGFLGSLLSIAIPLLYKAGSSLVSAIKRKRANRKKRS